MYRIFQVALSNLQNDPQSSYIPPNRLKSNGWSASTLQSSEKSNARKVRCWISVITTNPLSNNVLRTLQDLAGLLRKSTWAGIMNLPPVPM